MKALSVKMLGTALVATLVTGAVPGLTTAQAAPPKAKAPAARSKSLAPRSTNWNGQVAVTANGSYRVGNPDAPVKITEYFSYTCPHCAHFQKESDAVLRLTAIPKGQVSMTVTNLLFNPIDATIAMLTSCGDPKRFFVRHNAFLATQDKWLPKARDFSREQQQRWYQSSNLDSMRAIASDFGFYDTMEMWGSDRAQVDACLANPAMIAKLKQQQAEVRTLGIESTPSFILNGEKLDAHDWASVSKAITAKLAEQRAGNI